MLLGGWALVLLTLSWRRWPDVIIDFGRELYVAWRLSQGDVLFRDVAYFNGPLSPYVNAGLFRVFGPGLMVLAWANLAIAGLIAILLYALLKRIGNRFSAILGVVLFVSAFAFSRVTEIGNYNYVCPYSHEMTHGLALSLLAIYLMARYAETRTSGWLAGSGMSAGLVFLTKPDIFIALALALAFGSIATREQSRRFERAALFVGAASLPVIAAGTYFYTVMGAADACRAVIAGWASLAHSDLFRLPLSYNRLLWMRG